MSIQVILGSVVISAIISGFVGIYTTIRTNKLEYITKERSKWREEIRKCAEELRGASYQNTIKICDRVKDRINAFGRRVSNRYSDDAHIWKLIGEIESDKFEMKNLQKMQMVLQEYLSLLLKWDWERSKKEVEGEITKVFQLVLWIASIMTYTIALLFGYKLKEDTDKVQLAYIVACIMLVVIVVLLISYFLKQTEENSMIALVGHVLKGQKKTSLKKYSLVSSINLVLAAIVSCVYIVLLFRMAGIFGIPLSDIASVTVLIAGFLGCGAIISHQIYMSEYTIRYYKYAHSIDLILEELDCKSEKDGYYRIELYMKKNEK